MEQFSHEANKEYSAIIQFIKERLTPFFMNGKEYAEKIAKVTGKLSKLDNANPGFLRILHDKRENNKKMLRVTTPISCIFIDFILLYNGLTILCDRYHWSIVLKILFPVLLVLAEISISYFSIIEQRGINKSNSRKVLQYCIIGFLIAFSILVIGFSMQGYNPQFDGDSKLDFILKIAIVQVIMLVPAIFMHIWVINNAEEIAEGIAYFKFKSHRKSLVNEIEKLEANKKTDTALFIKMVQNFVDAIDAFKRNHPNIEPGFDRIVPYDLARAINTIMGRTVINIGGSDHMDNSKNSIK